MFNSKIPLSNPVLPEQPLSIQGRDGIETFKIDEHTIGVRPKWISVNDRLPGRKQCVKVKDQYIEVKAKFIEWEDGALGYYFCCDEANIDSNRKWTHWMPLPKPPKE